ncbi:caspase-7-like [Oppia nitens]|uniref:caspase-7-like n=1 Tax=Oppia nitens TaxID=1686743 RepID=UPI0023DC2635|nr:caspase-7-like [Oppia nitens]
MDGHDVVDGMCVSKQKDGYDVNQVKDETNNNSEVQVVCIGGDGHQSCVGGSGHQSCVGGSGHQSCVGGSGHQSCVGGSGHQSCVGGSGHQSCVGGSGHQSCGGGSGDQQLPGQTVGQVVNNEAMLKVIPCDDPFIGDDYYRMTSKVRGFCLIFNIFEFQNTNEMREGSVAEANRLKTVFEQLLFDVKVMDNPHKKAIDTYINDYSQRDELKNHDAFILIVLSHGVSHGFKASDGQYISFKDIAEKLNNMNCHNLVNKPKLLFFSCCRGDIKDFGIEHNVEALETVSVNSPVTDSVPFVQQEDNNTRLDKVTVPTISDIMICYSTVDGYVSWRCRETGTWLGFALCQNLIKHSHEWDLLRILTKISNDINDRRSDIYGAKQVIEVILRGFKKTFFFNPGYSKPDDNS